MALTLRWFLFALGWALDLLRERTFCRIGCRRPCEQRNRRKKTEPLGRFAAPAGLLASTHRLATLPMGTMAMANVGRTTMMLVVAGSRPFSSGVRTTASFLRAEAIAADGAAISILTAEELRDRIAAAAPMA